MKVSKTMILVGLLIIGFLAWTAYSVTNKLEINEETGAVGVKKKTV